MSIQTIDKINVTLVIPTVEKVNSIKKAIVDTAAVVGKHIRSGGDVHVIAEKDDALEGIRGGTLGFMSSEDYLTYLAIKDRIDYLRDLINEYQLPSGSLLWYDADISKIPVGWHLVENASELNVGGRAIKGTSSDGQVGSTSSATGKNSVLTKLIPMHLICKD